MSSPGISRGTESSESPEAGGNVIYESPGGVDWEDDDDMDFEPASESMEESLPGESDFDETEYYGARLLDMNSLGGRGFGLGLTL